MAEAIVWVKCSHPGCDNEVDPRRVKAGHTGCIELHSDARKEVTIVPMPKSNAVVGPASDLKGIANSHKAGSTYSENDEWYLTFTGKIAPRQPKVSNVQVGSTLVTGLSDTLVRKILDAEKHAGGYYVAGDVGLPEGYRKVCSLRRRNHLVSLGMVNGCC